MSILIVTLWGAGILALSLDSLWLAVAAFGIAVVLA